MKFHMEIVLLPMNDIVGTHSLYSVKLQSSGEKIAHEFLANEVASQS